MSQPIEINLSAAASRLVKGTAGAAILQAVAATLDKQNELTIGASVRDRMSFPRTGPATPEGLRVQSGLLRKSLTRDNARVVGDAVLSSIGSNVRYFGVHEFGFKGTVTVRPHVRSTGRRFRATDGSVVNLHAAASLGALTKKGTLRRGTGIRELDANWHGVHAHTREVNMPARRMVGRTVEARAREYRRALERAVINAANAGGAA